MHAVQIRDITQRCWGDGAHRGVDFADYPPGPWLQVGRLSAAGQQPSPSAEGNLASRILTLPSRNSQFSGLFSSPVIWGLEGW